MTDLEPRLRAVLKETLDPVVAERGRAAAAVGRARRGRALRGAATGLACVLAVAAAALAWERRPSDEAPRPAAEPPAVETFALEFKGGDGTLTVDAPKAQACLDLSRDVPGFGGRLYYDPDGPDDPVVADFGAGITNAHSPLCVSIGPDDARRVLAEPARHYVELGPRLFDQASPLEPLDAVPALAPDVAVIVCSRSGAVALTPQVQPREDGVHLRFYNPSRRWRTFQLFSDDGGNEGGRVSFGTDHNVSTFAPGVLYAGCFERLDQVPLHRDEPAYTSFTIVDPRGLWTDDDLSCAAPAKRRPIVTDVAVGEDSTRLPDFEALIREHVPGLEAGDVLERPGYPGTEFHFEPRIVVREGRRIASLMLVSEDGLWAIWPRACPGSGVAGG
ncbi:MAG TPA: hypothetical protein VHN37_10005 [Actinomycetota bacterium]|nr:hypothetical protein [Actinomycetota bacterium]